MNLGDYVHVKLGVWDVNMPKGRRDGLVVKIIGKKRDQVNIMFHNGKIIKFHKSQVKIYEKPD